MRGKSTHLVGNGKGKGKGRKKGKRKGKKKKMEREWERKPVPELKPASELEEHLDLK